MNFKQPDLINLETPKAPTNSVKEMDAAQDPSARARELRKRGAERPKSQRVKRPGVKASATISDWQNRADVGFKDEE